jgi:hypothetical protein
LVKILLQSKLVCKGPNNTILSSSGNNLHTENTFVGLTELTTIKIGQ